MTSDNARNSVAPPNLPMHHPTEPVPALHLTTSHKLNYPMQQDPSFPQYQRYINILRSLTQYPLVLKNLPPLHLSSLLCLHTILHGHHPILHDHPPQLHTIMTRHYYHSIWPSTTSTITSVLSTSYYHSATTQAQVIAYTQHLRQKPTATILTNQWKNSKVWVLELYE